MKALGAILAFVIAFATLLYIAFANGFVLSKIWLWYAVPRGLPVLSWQECAAFAAALQILRAKPHNTDESSSGKKLAHHAAALSSPWLLLLVMWWLRG